MEFLHVEKAYLTPKKFPALRAGSNITFFLRVRNFTTLFKVLFQIQHREFSSDFFTPRAFPRRAPMVCRDHWVPEGFLAR